MRNNLEKKIVIAVVSLIVLIAVFIIVAVCLRNADIAFNPKEEKVTAYTFATEKTDSATKDEVEVEEKDVVIRDRETEEYY